MSISKPIGIAIAAALALSGCSAADVASKNISTEADQFRVTRRIVAINLITDKYLFVATGKCSIGNADDAGEISITCKVGANPDRFQKHYVRYATGSNIAMTVEQVDSSNVDDYHYEFLFRPETIIPTIVR